VCWWNGRALRYTASISMVMTRRLGWCVLVLGLAACSDSPRGPVSPPIQTPTPPITVPPTLATPVPTTLAPPPETTPTPQPPQAPPAHCTSDREAPRVFITTPREGATIRNRTVQFAADASDSNPITKVEFYYHFDVRGTAAPAAARALDPIVFIARKNNPPYSIQWEVPRTCNSTLSLYAWAYDVCGNVGEADLIRVSVCN
jgi:hypothetical protein